MVNKENEINETSTLQNGEEVSKEDFAKKIGAVVDPKSGWVTLPLNEVLT